MGVCNEAGKSMHAKLQKLTNYSAPLELQSMDTHLGKVYIDVAATGPRVVVSAAPKAPKDFNSDYNCQFYGKLLKPLVS